MPVSVSPGIPKRDASTAASLAIEYEHHEIHDGEMFTVSHYNEAVASGSSINICFQTPNTGKRVHAFLSVVASGLAYGRINEGVTVTAASGTAYQPRNRRRDSAKVSTVKDSNGAADRVTLDGTITVAGTELARRYNGGNGRTAGGDTRSEGEWVLAPNTWYSVVCEARHSGGGNIALAMQISFYEHTDVGV